MDFSEVTNQRQKKKENIKRLLGRCRRNKTKKLWDLRVTATPIVGVLGMMHKLLKKIQKELKISARKEIMLTTASLRSS